MNYSPTDLSANLNCRVVALKYERNYNLSPENIYEFCHKNITHVKFVALISMGFIDLNKIISSTII